VISLSNFLILYRGKKVVQYCVGQSNSQVVIRGSPDENTSDYIVCNCVIKYVAYFLHLGYIVKYFVYKVVDWCKVVSKVVHTVMARQEIMCEQSRG
jgi:hypothetical protein